MKTKTMPEKMPTKMPKKEKYRQRMCRQNQEPHTEQMDATIGRRYQLIQLNLGLDLGLAQMVMAKAAKAAKAAKVAKAAKGAKRTKAKAKAAKVMVVRAKVAKVMVVRAKVAKAETEAKNTRDRNLTMRSVQRPNE
jgi:hypothetical protein